MKHNDKDMFSGVIGLLSQQESSVELIHMN